MKLFSFTKGSAPIKPVPQVQKCSHPVSYQVALHEDPANPGRITGMKCSQCGERLKAAA